MSQLSSRALRAAATLFGITALTAVSGVGVLATQASPSFTTPTYDMTIGGPGHAFVYPWGMAWDPTTDTILTSDYNNYQVRRFSTSGTPLDIYSSRSALLGQQPYGMAVDPSTGDFVVDNLHGYLRYTSSGALLDTVDAEDYGGHYAPYIAISPLTGTVYLVSSTGLNAAGANIVLTFNRSDAYLATFGTTGTSCSGGQFGLIRGIDVDSAGNVYIDDVSNHCVQEFSATGTFESWFSTKKGLPTADQLSSNTRGLTVDRTNDLVYIADSAKQDVAVFSIASGSFGTYEGIIGTSGTTVGDECGGDGELDGPRDVAIGTGGTVYVSDYTCFAISAFNPLTDTGDPGGFIQQIPDPAVPPPAGGINDATDVAVSPINDTVYVSDTFNQRIQEFDGPHTPGGTPGAFVQMWGSREPVLDSMCAMDYPRGVAVDPENGNLWVNDTRSAYIKAYAPSGNGHGPLGCATPTTGSVSAYITPPWGGQALVFACDPPSITCDPGEFFYSRGIFVGGPSDDVYVTDSGNLRLQVLTQSGAEVPGFPVACGISTKGLVGLDGCDGVTVDSSGNIYAPSVNQGFVDVFNSSGTLVTTFGSGILGEPYDAAISPDGSILYVTDVSNNRVSEFSLASGSYGNYLGSFGSKGTAGGDFDQPEGISVDAQGDIFVMDYKNQRVEVFTP